MGDEFQREYLGVEELAGKLGQDQARVEHTLKNSGVEFKDQGGAQVFYVSDALQNIGMPEWQSAIKELATSQSSPAPQTG